MKKHLLLLLMMLLPMAVWADSSGTCGDNLTWTYVDATQTLTISGSGDMWNYSSYAPWYNFRDNILYLTIKEGVSSISYAAFFGCYSLTSVTIPSSVTSIGNSAFSNCGSLASIKVASANAKYDSRNNCNAIIETATNTLISGCKNTIIPNTVTTIGDNAFYYCYSLSSVTIPNSVTTIGFEAFWSCSGLTSVTIPNSVTSIGGNAFGWCSGLTSVIIGNSVTSIGGNAFSSCGSIASISVASGNAKYDSRENCNAIIETATNTLILGCKSTIIPNSVTSIGGKAFYGCSGLTSITIPSSVTSIVSSMFANCSSLTSITIPNSVTRIGETAFYGCSGLTSITIPNSVTKISGGAFYGCSSLTSVTIGNSVTSIGGETFNYCSNLTNVIVKMKTPVNIGFSTFSNKESATLYIPYGCKAAYESANYWKEFKEIVEMVEGPDISQMNNAIYVEPLSARAGDDVSIKVCMKNANAATSYGFELVLPQGLSIATTSEGDFDDAVTMSGRHKGHTLTTNKLADNTYKVGVASLSSKALTDNDGLVLTIKAHVADNMALGDYPIIIQNPLIVNTDGTKPAVQSTLSKITVADYTKGDVDGDGVVDLADAVLVINHYVGKPVNKFVTGAADVDGDGVIDLADAVRIVNFYVGKLQSLAPSINIDGLDPQ